MKCRSCGQLFSHFVQNIGHSLSTGWTVANPLFTRLKFIRNYMIIKDNMFLYTIYGFTNNNYIKYLGN